MINFDAIPGAEEAKELVKLDLIKGWTNLSLFEKQCVKVSKVNKTIRLILPKQLIDAYSITKDYNAYFIYYPAPAKLMLVISKNEITDADYKRALNPIGVGLHYILIPSQLIKRISHLEEFPERLWIYNTPKSTQEDIILEVYPA